MLQLTPSRGIRILAGAIAASLSVPALATWSIIMTDSHTKEVAIGSATCLIGIDLVRFLPVVRPMEGAAAAQSFIDQDAENRKLIWNAMAQDVDPNTILVWLEQRDPAHQTRQYGIVDTFGRAVTFTGSEAGPFADGIVGQTGTLTYAIQGNVITGPWVLEQAELAILNTPGGLPEKLMAAMQAARAVGGDGRCSCDPANPDACDPNHLLPDFKSAHVGFMIVTRRGDELGRCGRTNGCAQSDYYLKLNVRGARPGDLDPVLDMQQQFDAWRAGLVGITDAIESTIDITTDRLWNDGVSVATVSFQLRDYLGNPPTDLQLVELIHAPDGSAGSSAIGELIDLGGGAYQADVTAGILPGLDHIAVRVTDSVGTRLLQLNADLLIQDVNADLNRDEVVDLDDLRILLESFGRAGDAAPQDGDFDGDLDVDLADLSWILLSLPA